ncbi:MAG: serine--tRNA ligase [Candidatus Krumholzibacteriota bacterium]|nr:serine--tRNA ligase [Candidatus Krumholzibacteriota bacterium]
MLDKKFIRKEPEKVKKGIGDKGADFDIDGFLDLDRKMRDIIQDVELLKHERNSASLEVSRLKKEKKDASGIIARMKDAAMKIKEADSQLRDISEKLDSLLLAIPNLPHESVPYGTSEKDNPVITAWGEIPDYSEKPLPHWEIGEKLGILDMPAGVSLTGRGFVVLRGAGARLSRALVNFFLDIHERQGYEELSVPYLVSRDSMVCTGQLPKMEEDMYHCGKDDLFLIPTAEVPVTNIYKDSYLDPSILPKKCTAYSPCFRREAGSYGQDTKGLIRVHQFDKVEMVKFVKKEDSYDELETLLADACEILQLLELPYRVIELCTADLSFSAAKCYDIETFAPGVERWLEVSSCSNFEDFQARRAKIRTRREKDGKGELVHTLNGSGLALPRIIATILELNQTPTGKVRIPKALVRYMGGTEYIET